MASAGLCLVFGAVCKQIVDSRPSKVNEIIRSSSPFTPNGQGERRSIRFSNNQMLTRFIHYLDIKVRKIIENSPHNAQTNQLQKTRMFFVPRQLSRTTIRSERSCKNFSAPYDSLGSFCLNYLKYRAHRR